jgi:hypothetical protein
MLSIGAKASEPSTPDEYGLGGELFSGAIELHGRMYTHVVDMPPAVVRCANCHAVGNAPAVPRSLAPRLTHDLLLRPRSRRGGPLSNYDRDSFCTLLRQGVDPAHVLISVEMPRYTLSDANCRALWRYAIESGNDESTH